MTLNGKSYELRYISESWMMNENIWDAELCIFRGGVFYSWWFQQIVNEITTQ